MVSKSTTQHVMLKKITHVSIPAEQVVEVVLTFGIVRKYCQHLCTIQFFIKRRALILYKVYEQNLRDRCALADERVLLCEELPHVCTCGA